MQTAKNMMETDKTIGKLDFFDLYLAEDGLRGWVKVNGESNDAATPLTVLSSDHMKDAAHMALACKVYEGQGHQEYFMHYDGFNYRASVLRSQGGMYRVLRKQPSEIRSFDKLGIPTGIKKLLLQKKLRGLVLISGSTGAGKTTTSSSFVAERLKLFGGVAVTVEDPPEMPLDGPHGSGMCFQTYADQTAGGFSGALKRCVRMTPDIIFLGEIRDSETAKEAIKASVNGHLIIATIHAGNITQAIERLISMSETDELRSLLSEGLSLAIHQDRQPKFMDFKVLSLIASNNNIMALGLRQKIKKGETHTIKSDSEGQMNKLHNGDDL